MQSFKEVSLALHADMVNISNIRCKIYILLSSDLEKPFGLVDTCFAR